MLADGAVGRGHDEGLYHDAMAIWLRDLPVVPLTPGAGAGAVQLDLLAGLADR